MKQWAKYFLAGMRTGSLVFLIIFWLNDFKIQLDQTYFFSILITSGLYGCGNYFFEGEPFEDFAFINSLAIHFVYTIVIYSLFAYINNLMEMLLSGIGILNFILIYIFIWLGVLFNNYLNAKQINQALRERRQKLNKE